MPSAVTVFYPLHPLANRSLSVIAWPGHAANCVTVSHPDGSKIKIPLWMLEPGAARLAVGERRELSRAALTALVDLLTPPASPTVVTITPSETSNAATPAGHARLRERRGTRSGPTDRSRAGTAAPAADDAGTHRSV